jgi:hypothetical protein
MSTRSLTLIKQHDGTEIAVLYRHHDGYPTGHGAAIKRVLAGKRVVDGLGSDPFKVVNGAGDMAVQLIVGLKARSGDVIDGKVKAGSLYLYPPATRDCWEDFVYEVYCGAPPVDGGSGGAIRLVVHRGDANAPVVYDGPLDTFDPEAVEASYLDEDE